MKYIVTLPVLFALAACAQSGAEYEPILDGQPTAAFQSDLAACQSLAARQDQFRRDTLGATAVGALAGGALGALDEDGTAGGGAVVGALAGGLAGTAEAQDSREQIVIVCLRGRGHRVVG